MLKARENTCGNCPNDCGDFYDAQLIVLFRLTEPQGFEPKIGSHRIWNDCPGGLTKGALHSPLGCSLYFRVADTAPGDAGMDSAGGSVAMRTSSLKFQAAGDREYGNGSFLASLSSVFGSHRQRGHFFINQTTQLGTITQSSVFCISGSLALSVPTPPIFRP